MAGTLSIGTFQAALFDMDGTIIDSAANGERAWRTLADRWQLARPDRALFQTVHGMPAREALRRIVPAVLVDAASRELREIEVEDTAGVRALPGALPLLLALPEERKAIVTSSFREVTIARLAAAGIEPPRQLVTSEVVSRGKPHPEPFLAAAAMLGFAAEQSIAFEDTRPGIRSAKAAGCTVVALEGLHRRSELSEADFRRARAPPQSASGRDAMGCTSSWIISAEIPDPPSGTAREKRTRVARHDALDCGGNQVFVMRPEYAGWSSPRRAGDCNGPLGGGSLVRQARTLGVAVAVAGLVLSGCAAPIPLEDVPAGWALDVHQPGEWWTQPLIPRSVVVQRCPPPFGWASDPDLTKVTGVRPGSDLEYSHLVDDYHCSVGWSEPVSEVTFTTDQMSTEAGLRRICSSSGLPMDASWRFVGHNATERVGDLPRAEEVGLNAWELTTAAFIDDYGTVVACLVFDQGEAGKGALVELSAGADAVAATPVAACPVVPRDMAREDDGTLMEYQLRGAGAVRGSDGRVLTEATTLPDRRGR